MQNESVTEVDYVNILMQWVFLLGIVTMWLLPALLFYLLAKKHSRKRWLYFFIGLALSIVTMNLLRLIILVIKPYLPSEINPYVLPAFAVLFGAAILWAAYEFLKAFFTKSKIEP